MYSHEIEDELKNNNYCIDSNKYLYICNTSPQIHHIQYFPDGDYFHMDTKDNYHFEFKVYLKTSSQ